MVEISSCWLNGLETLLSLPADRKRSLLPFIGPAVGPFPLPVVCQMTLTLSSDFNGRPWIPFEIQWID